MATKGSPGKSLGQKHGFASGGSGGGDGRSSSREMRGQQGQSKVTGSRAGGMLGANHREATGAGNVGAKPIAGGTGHQGHTKGRGVEKVTEHHRR